MTERHENPSPHPDGPAYRIETVHTVIRCWNPVDAPLLKEAKDSSRAHLLPWMTWAHSIPEDLDTEVKRLRRFRAAFDQDEDYVFGIFSRDEARVLGGTGLHTRKGGDSFEIGYWIRADSVGRGLATEVSAALTRVAFELTAVDRLEICCDPANVRSAGVPRKLGYTHEATLRRRVADGDGVLRDAMVWSLFRTDYSTTPAANSEVAVLSVMGKRLI